MKSILIYNAHIVDPSQKMNIVSSLLIADGKIAWIGEDDYKYRTNDNILIDAHGWLVSPGFVDLHCHLRDPGFEGKETIASGTLAAAKGGYTTVCCMPNTEPAIDNQAIVAYIKNKASQQGTIRVLPIGCITKGRKGDSLAEMGELFEAGVIGFSDDGNPVMNSRLMRQALDYSRAFDLPVMEHCEDKILVEGGQMNEGIVSTRLGLPGMPPAAEDIMVARNLSLAELTGARLHLCHLSTSGSVEMVRAAKKKGLRVTAEVTPHHLTLTEELVMGYDSNAKVNPPLRTQRDLEALISGLNDDTIDAIATDHAPHTDVEKHSEFTYAPFGISILETSLGMLMSLVHSNKISVDKLISKLTCEPAAIIGDRFGKLGTLNVGSAADITIFDPDQEWKVDPKSFVSKGKNTPLGGVTLKGKVKLTFYAGKAVYKES